MLLGERDEIVTGRCGEPVKLNLGDVGYYRVEYDAASRAMLAKSMPQMTPADRLNLLADSWALVESGRAEPVSYLELVEELSGDDDRAVWAQVIRTFSRLDRLARNREERPALRAYARQGCARCSRGWGWGDGGPNHDDDALLRGRLIRLLGELGDEEIVAEAKSRFAAFVENPAALPPMLRETVTHLAGIAADRAAYDHLLALARDTTQAGERVRYYSRPQAHVIPLLRARRSR